VGVNALPAIALAGVHHGCAHDRSAGYAPANDGTPVFRLSMDADLVVGYDRHVSANHDLHVAEMSRFD
jgi:hypothetical protein